MPLSKWILKTEVWLQGLFFKANCQRAEPWIDKKKLKFYMKINFETKKGYRIVVNKNRFKNANSEYSESC